MDTMRELIKDAGSPIALTICETTLAGWHCHSDVEMLYVLKNEMSLRLPGREVTLCPDDILLVNSGELHELHADLPCMYISLRIKIDLLNHNLCRGLYFYCDSTTADNKMKFYLIKHCIAELVKLFTTENQLSPFFGHSIAYLFLNELSMHFCPEETARPGFSTKQAERFLKISTYVGENYDKNLTLEDVANAIGLQPQYVSAFFKRHFGVNFLTYYNEIRLSRAANQLAATNKPIERIAEECGFSESRTFTANFKKKYGVSPSAYRSNSDEAANSSEGNIKIEDYLCLLAEYLPTNFGDGFTNAGITTDTKFLQVQADAADANRGKFAFKRHIVLPSVREVLYSDIQELLETAQKEIGFERACFIVDDEDMEHSVIDKALKFVLSRNLKPLLFYRGENIEEAIKHLRERFGDAVEDWVVSTACPTAKNARPALSFLKRTEESGTDAINDTAFGACSMVKRVLERQDAGFEYFRLIDDAGGKRPDLPFFGGDGLFTLDGVKKPIYTALRIVYRIGGKIAAKGDGYFITQNDDKIQVLLYNYEHFAELYSSGAVIDETFLNRVEHVDKLSKMNAEVVLNNIGAKRCIIREYTLNRRNGSSFGAWVAMGYPKTNDPDIGLLKDACNPKVVIRGGVSLSGDALTLNVLLEPLEIRLIEISRE